MKPEIVNITMLNGTITRVLDTELGTVVQVGAKVQVDTFEGGLTELPWNSGGAKIVIEFLRDYFPRFSLTFDLKTGFLKYQVEDKCGNNVTGIVNTHLVKISEMLREISDGYASTKYVANARLIDPNGFEDIAFKLADILEKYDR